MSATGVVAKEQAGRSRAVARPSYSVEQLTAPAVEVGPWREVLLGCVALAVLLVCLDQLGIGQLRWGMLAVAVLLVGVGSAVSGWRKERRAVVAAQAHSQVMQQLGFPVRVQVSWAGWPVGRPGRLVVTYPPVEHSDMVQSQVVSAVNAAWAPESFTTSQPQSRRGSVQRVVGRLRRQDPTRVVLYRVTEAAVEEESVVSELEVLEGRIVDVAGQVFGADATVSQVQSEGDQVTSFAVTHKLGPRLVDDRIQFRISEAVSQMIPGRWRGEYDLLTDRATFYWRRPLPKMLPRPIDPYEEGATVVRLGQDEDGHVAEWDFDGVFAHLLVSGATRTGKTVMLSGIVVDVARLSARVFIIDPKRTEFMAMRDWPNVQMVASKVEDQVALLFWLRDLMMERYRLIEEEGYDESDFERLFVIVDEYKQFTSNVASWWRSIKVTGMPAQCPAIDIVGDLLRLAAAARIHVVLGTQRPDADTVGGEALAVDTPIPTPMGWTTMGQIEPGDMVLAPDGQPVPVTATTPVMYQRPCYRLTFSDGSTLVADAKHLWQVSSSSQRSRRSYRRKSREERWPGHARLRQQLTALDQQQLARVVTVSQFEAMANDGGRIDLLRRGINDHRWPLDVLGYTTPEAGRFAGRCYSAAQITQALLDELSTPAPTWAETHQVLTTEQLADALADDPSIGWGIPVTAPIDGPDIDLPIDPWLLGYWLGDGHKATAAIATNDSEVLQRINRIGYRTPHYGRYNYGVVLGTRGQHTTGNLKTKLRDLNLIHNKHVPEQYFIASARQRADLLAGLLDSDGAVCLRSRPNGTLSGQVAFTNTNPLLIEAVARLAASLGFVPTVTPRRRDIETGANSVCLGSTLQPAWIVKFTPDRQVFGISRKQDALAPALDHHRRTTTSMRYITAIEPIDSVPVRCITVDSQDHLYLAGHRYIATHNCRDNFSARCSTGALSPDGAKMMYGSEHIGVAVPKVQGRGYYAGSDGKPKQVQYFYTPNPRKAKKDEDKQLLAALKPEQVSWQRLAWAYPDDEQVEAWLLENKGTKASPQWVKILLAQLTDYRPAIDVDVVEEELPADEDLGDGFADPVVLCPSQVRAGDLVELELHEQQQWVTVTECRCEGETVWIGWISEDDDDGLFATDDDCQVMVRHPLGEDGAA